MQETKSSLFASRCIQQTNLSALSTLSKQYIKQISAEGELFLNAPAICAKIWREFRRQDFTNVQIPYNVALQVYQECREDIQLLLHIKSGKEFFEVFDQDNDGVLNEDEQILVFSVIKEKMQQVGNLLLKIQQYMLFKQLMIVIRQLESKINEYQNYLRHKIYQNEKKIYSEIGVEKLDDFYSHYYDLFQNHTLYSQQKIEQELSRQDREMGELTEKLNKNTVLMKVKPKKKLKDLQTQEKLVSLEERVEEALDFRKELGIMEKSEAERVKKEQEKRIKNERDTLSREHRKKMEQLKAKSTEQEHKLIIQMNKDYNVLLKQIGLHNNEIERIQSSATQSALKKGREEGELKRTKERAKIQNFIISDSKRMNNSFHKKDETLSPKHIKTEKEDFRSLIQNKNYTQFYIKKKYGADLPVNFKAEPYRATGDNHERIEKILSVKKKNPHDMLPSITELYGYDMQQIHFASTQKSDQELTKEKEFKKAFILEKLLQH